MEQFSHEKMLRVGSELGAEEYRLELEVELAKIGPDAFCQKYGATQHAINPLSRIQRAVISQLERGTDEGYRLAEADRGAEMVGHADNANRIARRANRISARPWWWRRQP